MSLYRTHSGHVSHSNGVPDVPFVPSRREAESAFITVVAGLPKDMIDLIDDQLSTLRDFIWSR